MYREADVSAIEAAWKARDRKTLSALGARLGLALAPELLSALVKRGGTSVKRRDVIATLLEAATYEDGIALYVWDRALCLAVRAGDRVTAAVAVAAGAGAKPSKIWPELKPWRTDLVGNRDRAERWALVDAEDRVAFSRTAVAAAPALPDDRELLQQILEQPDDPAPREVLVDLWLSRDDVRGKLAKLDLEIAALPIASDARKKREAVRAVVIKQHGARIAGPEIVEHATDYTLHGGFVEDVTLSGAAFRDHGAALFARQPIRTVVLQPATPKTLAAFAKGPVDRVRALELRTAGELSLAPLQQARLERLERLIINGGAPLEDEAVFAALHAPRLRILECMTPVHVTALRGLARNRAISACLEELVIRPMFSRFDRAPGEEAIARDVFESLALPRLRKLHVRAWYVTDANVARLRARAPLLTDVEVAAT